MRRRYGRPPVVEAVCEIALQGDTPWDTAVPGLVYCELSGEYPKREGVRRHVIEGRVTGSGVSQSVDVADGLRILSDDGRRFVQLLDRRVSVHQLSPYVSWDDYGARIERVLNAVLNNVNVTGYERLGLRYVNDVELAQERAELEEYFRFYPEVKSDGRDGLPRDHGPFRMAVDFVYEDDQAICRVQLASLLRAAGEPLTVRLDLDYFRPMPGHMEREQVVAWIGIAHARLGGLFEGCITDRLREQFGEGSE